MNLPSEAPAVVLDTNVALDWLVFRDVGVSALAAAIEGGMLRWLACPRMRDELARTLTYPALAPWSPDSECVLATFDRWVQPCAQPPAAPGMACRDADDQVFVDLAVAGRAQWLLTRDRALLDLAAAARRRGLTIA
ncbi:MAG: putative toxin-antitoxin system toxin component, PIN family, partial [Burkholderiales bacterium]|nr:putative toxin-antitoxin system toxin component, PIN family [Burkholderiales bacterium]